MKSVLFTMLLSMATFSASETKRMIEPADCVKVRYLDVDYFNRPIQINPQRTLFAYVVKAPNLVTNQNDIELFVGRMDGNDSPNAKPLLVGQNLSQMKWLSDGHHLSTLIKRHGRTVVAAVDAHTGQLAILARAEKDIQEYSMDSVGRTLVYATNEDGDDDKLSLWPTPKPTDDEVARGYLIPMEPPSMGSYFKRRQVFLSRRTKNGTWSSPERVAVTDPFTQQKVDLFAFHQRLGLSLAPDGRNLVFRYIAEKDRLPSSWEADEWLKHAWDGGFPGVPLQVVYELHTKKTSMPFPSPFALSIPIWSEDSKSFAVVAQSPVDSRWAKQEGKGGAVNNNGMHLFSVNIRTSQIEEVTKRVADTTEQPLMWRDKNLFVHTSRDTVSQYTHDGHGWNQKSADHVPLPDIQSTPQFATDGELILGDAQSASSPPTLFRYKSGDTSVQTIRDLNPDFRYLQFPRIEHVEWTTSTGFPITGVLLLPPQNTSGRIPLVIQTKIYGNQFVCDTGESHYPSFPPVPLADAGIAYLMRTYPPGYQYSDERAHYPTDYPEGIREAAFQVDVWDSAVAMLRDRGLIDDSKVGIIGFSRSGWYTEFALTHGKTHYAAATTTDNVEFSLSEYWLLHTKSQHREYDAIYGGNPYEIGSANWMKYSISFNLDKVHTPLLMEEMGYGIPFENRFSIPYNLAAHFELFAGLNRLGKPVELFYYPNEFHILDHPKARLSTLERNVDWYRFWLQNFERNDPLDGNKYRRWRAHQTSATTLIGH